MKGRSTANDKKISSTKREKKIIIENAHKYNVRVNCCIEGRRREFCVAIKFKYKKIHIHLQRCLA